MSQTALDTVNLIDIKNFNKAKIMFAKRFELMPDSWYIKCIERFCMGIEHKSKYKYVVKGDPKTDRCKQYTVVYKGILNIWGEEDLFCPCNLRKQAKGYRQTDTLCTHMGSVILKMIYDKLIKGELL